MKKGLQIIPSYLFLLTIILLYPSSLIFALTDEKDLSKQEVYQKLTKISVPFIENKGQTDANVAYYAKTLGGTLFVTKEGELVYSLPKLNKAEGKEQRQGTTGGIAIKEKLINAKIKAIKGEKPSETKVSYFTGNDHDQWKNSISTYDLISFGEVYDGIELKLKAYGKNVEKLFYVNPNAEPSSIAIQIEGAKRLKIDEKTKELIAVTELGEVRFTKPIAYYLEEPEKRIGVSYKVQANIYTFALTDYDKNKTIVIDPLLASTYLGGSANEYTNNTLAIDSSGNVYVAGNSNSSNFPTTAGAYDTSYGSSYDIFISKFNSGLTSLLASTYLGGSNADYAFALAIDSSGNVYVAGYTLSSNFPTTAGAYDTSFGGGTDAFISKFNSGLTSLLASTYLGGNGDDYAYALKIDSSGNVYVAGSSYSFPTTAGAYDTSPGGNLDAFISKLNSGLTSLLASTYLGGSGADYAFALAIDSSGNIYVTGQTDSSNFPTTAGAYDTSFGGGYDAFISKLNSGLTSLLASTYLGGNGNDYAYALAIDSSGNVYVAGNSNSSDFPTTAGAYKTSPGGNTDAFISKFNSGLTSLLASTYLGGSNADTAYALAIDSSGNVYVAGETASSNFPTTAGAYKTSYGGGTDAFISKLNSGLTSLLASTYLGGSSGDHAYALAINSSGNIYVAGYTISTNFPTTTGAYATSLSGGSDVFVSKFSDLLGNTLYITKAGTGSGTVTSNPTGINCGADCTEPYNSGTVITLTATADANSDFVGWSGNADCSDGQVTMTGDITCTATFNIKSFQVTATASGNGSGSISSSPSGISYSYPTTNTGSANFNYGTNVILTASAAAGSTVTWSTCSGTVSGNGTTTATCTFSSLNGAKTASATFTLNQFQVTATASGNGSGSISSSPSGISYSYPTTNTGSANFNYGTNVILTASAAAGSTVTWSTCSGTVSGNGTTTATCTFSSLNGAKTASATFTLNQFQVTATASGNGSGSISSSPSGISYSYPTTNTGSANFNYGTNVILTASATAGSTVTWSTCSGTVSGNGTTTATCTFSSLNGAKTASAEFTAPPVISSFSCPAEIYKYQEGSCSVTASVQNGTVGYLWTLSPDGNVLDGASEPTMHMRWTTEGEKTVTVKVYQVEDPTNYVTRSAQVTVNEINFTLSDIVCVGDLSPNTNYYQGRNISCTATAVASYGTPQVKITTAGVTGNIEGEATVFVFTTAGTKTIKATATIQEIPDYTIEKQIDIVVLSSLPDVSISCDKEIWKYQNGTCVATATSPWGNINYNWQINPGSIISTSDNTVTIMSQTAGDSTVTVTAYLEEKPEYMKTVNAIIKIKGINPPTLQYTAPVVVTRLQEVTFTGTGSSESGPVDLKWILWDDSEVQGNTLNITFSELKQYKIKLVGIIRGHESDPDATAYKEIIVNVYPGLKPTIRMDGPYSLTKGESAIITAIVTPPPAPKTDSSVLPPIIIKWELPDGSVVMDQTSVEYYFDTIGQATFSVSAWLEGYDLPDETAKASKTVKVLDYYFPDFKITSFIKGNVYAPYFTYFAATPSKTPISGSVFRYDWDFGDGETYSSTTSKVAVHTFSEPGTYTVTLTVTDKNNEIKTDSIVVTVLEAPPINIDFKFISTNKYNRVPYVVVLRPIITGGNPQVDRITSYEWSVNGVLMQNSTMYLPLNVTEPGEYTVGLRISTKTGKTASGQYIFTANPNQLPVCDFIYKEYSQYKYTKFIPYCSDPDGRIVSYEWDFGNGVTANTNNPYISYKSNGEYTVKLKVKDDSGAYVEVSKVITVNYGNTINK